MRYRSLKGSRYALPAGEIARTRKTYGDLLGRLARIVLVVLSAAPTCCNGRTPTQIAASDPVAAQTTAPAIEVTRLPVATDRTTLPHLEPVVAVHPSRPSVLAVAAMVIESPNGDHMWDTLRVALFISTDGGTSWASRALPPTRSGPAVGDPTLAWAADGTLYLTALVMGADRNLKTWLWSSRDEGRSWRTTQVVTAASGSQDHPVLDLSGPSESQAVAVFATTALTGISASLLRPDAETFSPAILYSPDRENNNLGAGLSLDDGRRLLFTYYSMSRAMPVPLWAVRSDDSGRTWTRSQITNRQVPVGFPMLAQDRSTGTRRGRVYAVWVSDEETGSVMLAGSDDGGATWSAPVVVHQDRSKVLRARPALHVNRDGLIAVSWTDGRHDSAGRGGWCWDIYAAISTNGGATFHPEIQLTDSLSCAQTPGNGGAGQRWRWGGDYAGIASDPLGRFYVVWSDSRTGVFQPRLARLAITPLAGKGSY